MFVLFRTILDKITSWIEKRRISTTKGENTELNSTHGNIENRVRNMTGRKLFRIDDEQILSAPPPILPEGHSNRRSSNGFKVEAVTRPKQCKVCKTENKITRLPSNQWQCTECGYTWR